MRAVYFLLGVSFITCKTSDPNNDQLKSMLPGITLPENLSTIGSDTIGVWSIDYIMGKFEPAEDTAFILIDSRYADREGLYLRKDVYQAFLQMHDAALTENIKLIIRSATRNFEYQKKIWEDKWDGRIALESNKRANTITDEALRAREILKYSSMPGSSRHHWGTDIDLNAFNNAFFENGSGLLIYNWLMNHAGSFGFCQPYSQKDSSRPNGYEEEKWHWSYLPISRQLTVLAEKNLRDTMITGFKGAEQAQNLEIVRNYVLGIDSTCLDQITKL
ncbi:MAG: M15 family metallopeptidase [Saprospiraceae bacterium]|nr:M15 family metallopeptidase [Saprospiraceae bacterium]